MLEPNWLDEVLESLQEERATPCPSVSLQEKTAGGQITEAETRMDKGFSNSVPLVPPVPPKNINIEKKSADIEETQRAQRREKVLAILTASPQTQRAFLTDTEADPDNVILTMAIRDKYSFEMLIPKHKYDAFMVLELLNGGGTSH